MTSKKTSKQDSNPKVKVEEVKAVKPGTFKANVDGKEKTFQITDPKFKLGNEIFTAEEASANAEVCKKLVQIGAGNIKEIFPEVKK